MDTLTFEGKFLTPTLTNYYKDMLVSDPLYYIQIAEVIENVVFDRLILDYYLLEIGLPIIALRIVMNNKDSFIYVGASILNKSIIRNSYPLITSINYKFEGLLWQL